MAYEFPQAMSQTHARILGPLGEGEHTYYVRCRSDAAMDASEVIQFNVELPPRARIVYDEGPPLKVGVTEIGLVTSKDVRRPLLTYSIDGSSFKEIPLTGSGQEWNGYIVISENSNNKIGVFEPV